MRDFTSKNSLAFLVMVAAGWLSSTGMAQQILPQPVTELEDSGDLWEMAKLLKEEQPEYARLHVAVAEEEEGTSGSWVPWNADVSHFIYKRHPEDEDGYLFLDGDFRWVIHDLDSLRNISRSQTKDISLNAYPTVFREKFGWVGGYGYFRFHRNWWILGSNGGVGLWKDQATPLSFPHMDAAPPNVIHGIWRDDERDLYCYFTNRHALDEPNSKDASYEIPDSLKALTSRFQLWEDLDFGKGQNSFRHVADVNVELFGEFPPVGIVESQSWVILHHSPKWTQGAPMSLLNKSSREWYFLKQDHPLPLGPQTGLNGWMFRGDSLLVVADGVVVNRLDISDHVAAYETTQEELLQRKSQLFVPPKTHTVESAAIHPGWMWAILISMTALLTGLVVRSRKLSLVKEELASTSTQLEVIGYFSQSIFRKNSADAILNDMAEQMVMRMGFDHCLIYMLDEERSCWQKKAFRSKSGFESEMLKMADSVALNEGIVGAVGMSGTAERISRLDRDSRSTYKDGMPQSEMAVPIVCDGRVIGVIANFVSAPQSFTENHLKVIQNVANICGQKIGRSLSERRTQELSQVYEQNPGPVLRLSSDGMVLLSNDSAKKKFGADAMLGEVLKFPELVEEAKHALESNRIRIAQFKHRSKVYQVHLLPNVAFACVNAYASEVTALQQAKSRAEKAERAKADFLSVMSHEIRTPLNAIIGLNDLLLKEDLTEDQATQLRYMKYSGGHLLSLINDILSLESLDSGKAVLSPELVNLTELLEGIAGSFQARAQQRNTEIKVNLPDPATANVMADRGWVSQIVHNLVDNAVKFTSRGTVTVTARKGREKDKWVVSVEDSGVGIPNEHLDRITDPFEQVVNERTKNTKSNQGTGLGLAIVKRLVHLHGGTMTVRSTLGVGSAFTLEMAMPEVEGREADTPPSKQKALGTPKALNILVVDDNQINLLVADRMVQAMGHQTVTAVDGEDALVKWEKHRPDLILMDVQMPGMDGLEATRIIRNRSEERQAARVAIVALTADAESSTRQLALEAGVDAFLVKPIDSERLSQVIEENTS